MYDHCDLLDQDACRLCQANPSLAAHADSLPCPGGECVRCFQGDNCLAPPIHRLQLEQPSLGEVRSDNMLLNLCHRFAVRSWGSWGSRAARKARRSNVKFKVPVSATTVRS